MGFGANVACLFVLAATLAAVLTYLIYKRVDADILNEGTPMLVLIVYAALYAVGLIVMSPVIWLANFILRLRFW